MEIFNFSSSAREIYEEKVLKVIETGVPILGFEVRDFIDEKSLFSTNIVPIRGLDGNVERILTIRFDITAAKQNEEQLRQAQKMETVGQLTAGVAHDFNNLLTVVLGNLELLHEDLGENRKQKDLAERAIGGATRGAELTHRLLAFSRKQTLAPERIEIGKIVSGMIDLLRRTLGETIAIETALDKNLWLCKADPGQLEDVLLNLSINARDAMPDGGKITIEAGNAPLDDEYAAAQVEVEPGEYVVITVTDTGIGMPPEVREKVFEPFFTTKEVGKGTGLGLSMVYGFVKQSGGHITIYSEEGRGTTFRIYLPRIEAETGPEENTIQTNDDLPARGETILVVEDDADLRTLVVNLLGDLGYAVLEAGTAPAALQQLDTTSGVNLLLTDLVLAGGMSGRVLAEEVQQRFKGIKVLYMSGYSEDAVIHHGRLSHDVALLQKPFRRIELQRKVRHALDAAA
jgi:signal transduction histidine kinase